MQETQQVEEMQSEFISLSEFIPNWTYTNLVGKTNEGCSQLEDELKISIADGGCCIVGEAHGGKDSNYDECKICNLMSYGKPWDQINSRAIHVNRNPEEFMKLKKELYSHMIDYHPQKMRR